jgi:hypothetical protein
VSGAEEHRAYLSADLPHGIKPIVSYAYGRDVDPLAVGLSFAFKRVNLAYMYRLSSYGFDSPHLFGLRFML